MSFVVAGIFSWPYWIGKVLDYTMEFIKTSKWNQFIATSLFAIIAILIYKVKINALLIYGTLEFVAGVMTIHYSFSHYYNDNTILALAIGGGMFLIVNGIGNYKKGHKISEEKKAKELKKK